MELTLNNYHSLENRYLTNSRIGDWEKCKCFFFERHVSGQRPYSARTDAMKVGSAVDTWLFFGESEFRKQFVAVDRRNVKNPPTSYTELTPAQYADVEAMAKVLTVQPAFLKMADHETQKIMTLDMPLGEHFCGLACIPDWIKIYKEKGVCIITDLKTAADSDDRKYHWKCLDFGYYRQMAVMTIIVKRTHPEIKEFLYRHLVIEKDKDGIFAPSTFILSPKRVNNEVNNILDNIIPAITAEKDFKPKEVDWDKAVMIGDCEEE